MKSVKTCSHPFSEFLVLIGVLSMTAILTNYSGSVRMGIGPSGVQFYLQGVPQTELLNR